jgi:hypothetical protein
MKYVKSTSHGQELEKVRGLRLSKAWRGYGSALFFELGELLTVKSKRKNGTITESERGEYTLMIEWDWRIEKKNSIWFGSSCSQKLIDARLKRLSGAFVNSVQLEGRIPELYVTLSNGMWLRTCSMTGGQNRWTIFRRNSIGQIDLWYECVNRVIVQGEK